MQLARIRPDDSLAEDILATLVAEVYRNEVPRNPGPEKHEPTHSHLLEFADLFLILLSGFIMVALRLSAPFMIAVAIDQRLAHQISYPFVKGAAIFTLVTPAVSKAVVSVRSAGLLLGRS